MLPTTTARRYLVPTALGASGRCIPAVAVIVVAGAVEGAAAALGPEVAAPTATAAADDRKGFPPIGSSPEEESISSSEEESTPSQEKASSLMLSSSSWNRNWRSSPSVSGSFSSETTPKSNSSASQCRGANASYAAVGFHSGVGSRLSGMESMEEAEREEEEGEEEEEESQKELEPEEVEIAMVTGGGVFYATWIWRKMSLP